MKPKDQSAIDKILLFLKNYSSEEDEHGIVRIQIGNILAKELSLAEQRGREEAIEEVGKQLQEKWENDPRSEKDKKIGGSSAWRLGYLQALRDTSVDMRKLKKGNQTLDKGEL